MNRACPCSICQSPEHRSRQCPELTKELETGFYKPAGGMPQGGGDDDEGLDRTGLTPLFAVLIQNYTSSYRDIQGPHDSILANTDNRSVKCL